MESEIETPVGRSVVIPTVWIVDHGQSFPRLVTPILLCRRKTMIKKHDRIVLTESVPTEGLEPGDVGTVVHVYADGKAYEVEFVALDGHTRAVATLEAHQVRPVSSRDMTHARAIQTA